MVKRALDIIARRFADDARTEGYRKDGPVAVAKFEIGEGEDLNEPRKLRQRDVSTLMITLLGKVYEG